MQLVLIEAVFERIRAQVAPALPSRFESAFLWPTIELARNFREQFRPRGVIHRCLLAEGSPLLRDASFVAAGMDLSALVDDEIRTVQECAVRYWTTDAPIEFPEVLVQGTVVVTEVLSPQP